jgi:hypothetical protein
VIGVDFLQSTGVREDTRVERGHGRIPSPGGGVLGRIGACASFE